MGKGLVAVVGGAVLGLATCGTLVAGGSNPFTPAGHEGYITQVPWFRARSFQGTQVGPASTGYRWTNQVINVDMRPITYSESYEIMSKDDLKVSFESHLKLHLEPGSVKEVVEEFGGVDWFAKNVQMQYNSVMREEVRQFNAYDIKSNTEDIAAKVLARMREDYSELPPVFDSVSIGNIGYPASVDNSINGFLARQQDLERMSTEEDIAVQKALNREEEAKGIKDAQSTVGDTLSPMYLQWEALEMKSKIAQSGNPVLVVIPTRSDAVGMSQIVDPKGGKSR